MPNNPKKNDDFLFKPSDDFLSKPFLLRAFLDWIYDTHIQDSVVFVPFKEIS